MTKTRAHVFVSGRVQGVFYRDYTQRQANALNVAGWVRNLADGRVEAMFEGEQEAVQRMVVWCRRGSPNAYVTGVQVDYEPHRDEFSGFRIRYW